MRAAKSGDFGQRVKRATSVEDGGLGSTIVKVLRYQLRALRTVGPRCAVLDAVRARCVT